jgi:hypothetical protein
MRSRNNNTFTWSGPRGVADFTVAPRGATGEDGFSRDGTCFGFALGIRGIQVSGLRTFPRGSEEALVAEGPRLNQMDRDIYMEERLQ